MNIKEIKISDFTYQLPDEKIAIAPLAERDSSKLLIYNNDTIIDTNFKSISAHIPPHTLAIFNNTRVIEARIFFTKSTGAVIEIFILSPFDLDMNTAMQQTNSISVNCFIGGASKWKHGIVLEKEIIHEHQQILLQATLINKTEDNYVVQLTWNSSLHFAEILSLFGAIPLPPYIKRKAANLDSERYQTVYAKNKGSVAAPTAGLHFTPYVFEQLKEKNIDVSFVTLNVGAGTFKPVVAETMQQHFMHHESFEIEKTLIQQIVQHNNPILAVGTTSVRTLESMYWLGVKVTIHPNLSIHDLNITQWEVYELPHIDKSIALHNLLAWMNQNNLNKLVSYTQLLIAPSYQFKVIDMIVTNFHQPKSTLLLLVAAATKNWYQIYDYALQNNFRFLSYGDSCLINIDK
jgi:S-adenosylmethionine:tRNA ribosyltransferase-isomerase